MLNLSLTVIHLQIVNVNAFNTICTIIGITLILET